MENPKKTQFLSTRTLKNGQKRLLEKTTLKLKCQRKDNRDRKWEEEKGMKEEEERVIENEEIMGSDESENC